MKYAIFLAEGFEECEALITNDILRRAKAETDLISISDNLEVCSSHSVTVKADRLLSDTDLSAYDVLILPGGKVGTENLGKSEELKAAVQLHSDRNRLLCAICAAPSILGHMGILSGKHYTCFPGFESTSYNGIYENELTVSDGNLITGRGIGATVDFAREILRHSALEQMIDKVDYGIRYAPRFRSLKKPQ